MPRRVREMGPGAWEAPRMFVAAVVVALALLAVAVSWGREIDDTAHDAADAERITGPRAA